MPDASHVTRYDRLRRGDYYADFRCDKRLKPAVHHCVIQRDSSSEIIAWSQYSSLGFGNSICRKPIANSFGASIEIGIGHEPFSRSSVQRWISSRYESCGSTRRNNMARKKLRLLKRVPPMVGVCEGCLAQFRSIFTRAIAAEAEIRVRFAAHKCVQASGNAARMRKAA